MLTPGKKSLELLDSLKKVGEGLDKITKNPDGGTLTVNIEETGQAIVFTMPPKGKRKHVCLVCGKYVEHEDAHCPERIQI